MKKIIAIVLALVFVLGLAACGSKAPDISGTYPGDYFKFVGDPDTEKTVSEGDNEFSLIVEKNGKGKFVRDGMEFNMTWKLDGENFTMEETFLGAKNEYTGTLKDGILTIFNGDPKNDFTGMYVFKAK